MTGELLLMAAGSVAAIVGALAGSFAFAGLGVLLILIALIAQHRRLP